MNKNKALILSIFNSAKQVKDLVATSAVCLLYPPQDDSPLVWRFLTISPSDEYDLSKIKTQ